jgi:hypothetical protein
VNYNPEKAPTATEWIALDESERISIVEVWHRRAGIRIPGAKMHALIHTVVENQIALGESAIVESLARLRAEGLSRHDAIHAIGSVLAEQIFHTAKGTSAPNLAEVYYDRVRRLSARSGCAPVRPLSDQRQSSITHTSGRLKPSAWGRCIATPCVVTR